MGKLYIIKKIDATDYPVTIKQVNGSVDLKPYHRIRRQNGCVVVCYDTSSGDYKIVSEYLDSSRLPGCVAWWRLEEDGAADRLDATGRLNVLTAVNSPPRAAGKVGYGTDFEQASSHYLTRTIGADDDLQIGDYDFSFVCWAKLESKTTNRRLAHWLFDATTDRLTLTYSASPVDAFRLRIKGSPDVVIDSSLGSVALDTWYLVYVGFDASSDTFTLGVTDDDGTEYVDTDAFTGGPQTDSTLFRLGYSVDGAGGNNYWDGLLDEAMFFRRTLHASERADLWGQLVQQPTD